jgi:hypothetical protein
VPKCTGGVISFSKVGRREVQAAFDGGDITSDGGLVLLREVDRQLGLTKAAAAAFTDGRRKASVRHSIRDMLAQRVYGLACGNEDVTDHNSLRSDLVLQTAVGRDQPLASGATLSRLETSATPELAARPERGAGGCLHRQPQAASARAGAGHRCDARAAARRSAARALPLRQLLLLGGQAAARVAAGATDCENGLRGRLSSETFGVTACLYAYQMLKNQLRDPAGTKSKLRASGFRLSRHEPVLLAMPPPFRGQSQPK